MNQFSYSWLILLGFREILNIFAVKTTFITAIISALQFLNLFFVLQENKFKILNYYLFIPFFLIFTVFNTDTLPSLNILLSFILLRKVNIQKVNFLILILFSVMILCYFWGSTSGILLDEVKLYKKGFTHTLGFRNSNTPAMYTMMITLCTTTFFIQKTKIKFPLILFLIPNYIVFILTLGRTSFYTVIFHFFLIFWFSFKREYKVERVGAMLLPILFFVTTLIFVNMWAKIPFVNTFFTGRFRIIFNHLKTFSYKNYLMGYKVQEGPMDCAYLSILFNGGILYVVFVLSTCFLGIKNMSVKSLKVFLPFVVAYFISGFTEGTFSLFRLATVLLYKILSDNIEFKFLKSKYLKSKKITKVDIK